MTHSSNTYIDALLAESEPKLSSDKGLDLGVDCSVKCCRGDGPVDNGGLAIALVVGEESAPGLQTSSLTIQAGRHLGGAHSCTEP